MSEALEGFHEFGKIVAGVKVKLLRNRGAAARWSSSDTRAIETFLSNNAAFLQWKEREGNRVTKTRLMNFPLIELYPLIGADGLGSVKNVDGLPVLPILDQKIYRKIAAIWTTLTHEQQSTQLLPRREPTEVYLHHHSPETPAETPVETPELPSMQRLAADLEFQIQIHKDIIACRQIEDKRLEEKIREARVAYEKRVTDVMQVVQATIEARKRHKGHLAQHVELLRQKKRAMAPKPLQQLQEQIEATKRERAVLMQLVEQQRLWKTQKGLVMATVKGKGTVS